MATRHWLTLCLTRGLGPILIARLVEACGSAEAACGTTAGDLQQLSGVGKAKAASLASAIQRAAADADRELDAARAIGVDILCCEDENWPALLTDTADAPPVLWVWGELQPRDLNAIAIVGSRRPSRYGQEQAERFAALLAGAGFTVVSGGAYGIDTRAHRGALRATNGRTLAVLGCGVDVSYPAENANLLADIAEGRGAVVSELPLGTGPRKEHFPRRNRIISGLCRGVLVVEAAERSGALITARVAADDHNRPVFAVPGRVDNPMSAGPHGLIRDGAGIATDLADIADHLGPLPTCVYKSSSPNLRSPSPRPEAVGLAEEALTHAAMPTVSETDRALLEALDGGATGADDLCDRTGLPASQVQSALTLLSLKGLVRRVAGNRFERK